jgi:hypothetical protein
MCRACHGERFEILRNERSRRFPQCLNEIGIPQSLHSNPDQRVAEAGIGHRALGCPKVAPDYQSINRKMTAISSLEGHRVDMLFGFGHTRRTGGSKHAGYVQ